MTPEEQIEWDLCKKDCTYFLNRYLQPKKYSPLLADFYLYPFQEQVLDEVEKGDFILINTARQMGISTILTGRALWKMLFNDNYTIAIMDPRLVQSIRHVDMVKEFYNQLPNFFKIGHTSDNKRSFVLSNGSSISAVIGAAAGTCSRIFDELMIDQASFIDELDEVIAAFTPLIHNGKHSAKMIIVSCLHKEGVFTKLCRKAEKGDFNFTYIKLPYWVHPKRGRAWRSQQDNELGPNIAKVELDCSYVFTKDGEVVPLNDE